MNEGEANEHLLSYIVLGLSLSAPVGPVNAAQIDKGIKNGFWHAWIFGLGAMAADGLYMILIYFGLSQFLTAPFVKTFLWLFGFRADLYGSRNAKISGKP